MFPEVTKRLSSIIDIFLQLSMSLKASVSLTMEEQQDLLKLVEQTENSMKNEGKPRK